MANTDQFIRQFFDAFVRELPEAFRANDRETGPVTWSPVPADSLPQDLQWWEGSRAENPEDQLLVGADEDTWSVLGNLDGSNSRDGGAYTWLVRSLEHTLAELGAPCTVRSNLKAEITLQETASTIRLEIPLETDTRTLFCVLSPALESSLPQGVEDLEAAGSDPAAMENIMQSPAAENPAAISAAPANSPANSMDMLMHVEVPIRISFGSTRVRIKELLSLTSGSVVELDQNMGESVEVRVNNCVIARGEVVAVDGNYGVRILELIKGQGVPVLNGSTK